MAKYTSVTISGYDATPPPDDGTVSEANKVKWSTEKTKLGDPLKTAIEAINTNLVSAFDVGPTALTTSTTLGATHYGDFVQTSGASLTHTLTDAATLGAGWHTYLVSTDANDVTIGRATGADTINGSAANITLYGNTVARIFVNAAGNGFIIDHGKISNNTFTPMQFFTAGIGPNYLQNISIAPNVGSKQLNVGIKTKAGADASSTDPIQIAFRNVTLTTGDYVIRNITAALSANAPNGATLGFTASQTGYVYVYALDNAGTVEVVLSGSNHWDEAAVHSTTASSATADSGSVLYSSTARTNVPIRYIGRIKIQTGAVAGEWDNAPTEIHVGYTNNKAASQGLTQKSGGTVNIWNGGESCHISVTTATITMTIASPGVVTDTAHGMSAGDPIRFTTTGALPTGVTSGTTYYVLAPTADTYTFSTTSGGAAVNTSGTQSGVHTVTRDILSFGTAPYAGATKLVIFDGSNVVIHSANCRLPGASNITTAAADTCLVYADTTTQMDILNYPFVSKATLYTKNRTVLGDASVTFDTASFRDSQVYTITPTAARAITVPTATNIISELPGYRVGTWFDFTSCVLAAFDVTLTTNTGVTLYGNAVANNSSGTWKVLVTSSTTVDIVRM